MLPVGLTSLQVMYENLLVVVWRDEAVEVGVREAKVRYECLLVYFTLRSPLLSQAGRYFR